MSTKLKLHSLSLLILFLFNSIIFSQNNLTNNKEYKTSKPFRVYDFDNNFHISKKNEILVIKIIRSHCIIQKFDTKIPELIQENRYNDFFPNNFKLGAFKEIEGKNYFFYSIYNQELKNTEVFAQEVDFENASFINNPILVLSTIGKIHKPKVIDYLHKNRLLEEMIFEFIQPKDNSKLLLKYITEVNNITQIKFKLIDKNLNEIFNKSVPIKDFNKKNSIISLIINKEANIHYITKSITENKEQLPDFFINTLRFNSIDIEQKAIKVDKYINDLRAIEDNENIIFCGFTANFDTSRNAKFFGRNELNDSNGLIYIKTNNLGEVQENKQTEFPKEIINFYKNKQDENHVNNLFIHDFEILENGEKIIIGEQYNTEARGQNNWCGIYRDIIIGKYNKNNQLEFLKRLPKIQESQNEMQPFSFKAFYTKSYIYLPFIDTVDNLDPKNTKLRASTGDLILSKISLIDGNIYRKYILNITKKDANLNKFSVNRFYKSDLDTFCFDAYIKNKEDILISVDLN